MAPAESIRVPLRITSGDSFAASLSPSAPYDDPAWSHALTLINAGARFSLAGTLADGVVTFTATAAWAPGRYRWSYAATLDGARTTLATGLIDVAPDTATAHDPRSHARKVLDALEAYLENADYAAARTKIADRELQNIPLTELLTLRNTYRAEVRGEEVAAGFRLPGRVMVRF